MTKKKNSNAMSTTALAFHNPGHAAQSRYVAALVNPFAAPPVPIPDSFLTAHCAKIAKEIVVTGVSRVTLQFYKVYDDATGNYAVDFKTFNSGGGLMSSAPYYCNIGSRLVAAGIHYENALSPLNISGMVTRQQNSGAIKNNAIEVARSIKITNRDEGEGNVRYTPLRRQALEFEGEVNEELSLEFSTPFSGILKYAALMEVDGDSGFAESNTSNGDFVVTTIMANHHAGQFADTPLPDVHSTVIPKKHTMLQKAGNALFSGLWSAGSHFVSSAAGWASSNPSAAFNTVKQLPYIGSLLGSSSVITSMETAAIRAAPTLLMLGL